MRRLNLLRSFSTTISAQIKRNQLPPRPKIVEEEITEVFIKGGGNGGQKINKTNSKVQLKHIPTGLVVESQFSRSREDNRKKAREILAMKLEEIALGGQSRAAVVAEYKRQKARKKKQRGRKNQREREQSAGKPETSADQLIENI